MGANALTLQPKVNSMSNKNDYVSQVKDIPYAQETVFNKMADLRNLETIREKFSDPSFCQQMEGQLGKDKIDEVRTRLDSLSFSQYNMTADSPIGRLTLAIIERDIPKCIKFEAQGAPIPLTMWVQLLPNGDSACKMRITLRAELNMFIRHMVEGKLQQGVEQIAEMLARLPYGN